MTNKTTKKASTKKPITIKVTENDIELLLLEFLYEKLSNLPKSKVKSFLVHKEVYVNNKCITKYNHPIKVGQTVEIRPNTMEYKPNRTDLEILYEDKDIIVINKPAGLLSMSTQKEKEKTAYHFLMDYVKQVNNKNRIFIVHRLDKDTSGVLMVAKNEKIKLALQENWSELVSYRGYLAIVEGRLEQKSGQIKSWLKETKTHLMYSSEQDGYGLEAITNYEVLRENSYYSLVSVWLDTGRKNQIRVHMSDMGNCICGDKKYGATTNPMKRLLLHAHKLEIKHPYTNEVMTFECNFDKKALRLAKPTFTPEEQ